MATEIKYGPEPIENPAPRQRIYAKDKWADEWELLDGYHCEKIVLTVNPQISHAVLSHISGRVMQPGETEFSYVDPPDLEGKLIKIRIADQGLFEDEVGDDVPVLVSVWAGVVLSLATQPANATQLNPEAQYFRHSQNRIVVYGFEALLERVFVTESHAIGLKINRAVTFNRKSQRTESHQVLGNRSIEDYGHTVGDAAWVTYLFATELKTAKKWTSLDIANYLTAYFHPTDYEGGTAIPFDFVPPDPGSSLGIVWYDTPILPTEGKTVKKLLDTVLDRRRLIGYTCEFVEKREGQRESVILRSMTFIHETITTPIDGEDVSIPANPVTYDVNVEFDPSATVVINRDSRAYVDKVIVRGARATATFTISPSNETLVSQWSEAVQTGYQNGGTSSPGYGSADPYRKLELHAIERAQDKWEKAFAYWGLPLNWDGKCCNGTSGTTTVYFPHPDPENSGACPTYYPDLRFGHHTILRTEFDYSGGGTPTQNMQDGQAWEHRAIFGIARLYDGVNDRYVWTTLDKLNCADNPCAAQYNVSTRPQHDAPGVVLNVQGQGAPQHLIGIKTKGDVVGPGTPKRFIIDTGYSLFVDTPGNDIAAECHPVYFFYKDLFVTVTMEVDHYCQGDYFEGGATGEFYRTEVIEIGERARLDYIAAGTIVGVTDGVVKTSNAKYVQDDRETCQAIAYMTYQWYSQERHSFTVSMPRMLASFGYSPGVTSITDRFRIGSYIERLGSDESGWTDVNCVVTQLEITFPETIGTEAAPLEFTLTTDFAEFDVLGAFRI